MSCSSWPNHKIRIHALTYTDVMCPDGCQRKQNFLRVLIYSDLRKSKWAGGVGERAVCGGSDGWMGGCLDHFHVPCLLLSSMDPEVGVGTALQPPRGVRRKNRPSRDQQPHAVRKSRDREHEPVEEEEGTLAFNSRTFPRSSPSYTPEQETDRRSTV